MVEIKKIAINELKPYAQNPRKGNIDLIAQSLITYGQYKPITVNQRTNEILAGNHTYAAAKKLGWAEIAVTYVDVDEATAAKIVLIDNRSTDAGTYDTQILLNLLDSFDSIDATGYNQEDYEKLVKILAKPDNGMMNTTQGATMAENAEKYADRTSRVLMLDYDKTTYEWLMERFKEYKEEYSLATNIEVLVDLLQKEYQEEAPIN